MKTCILVLAILGSAAAACASASNDTVALPEMKADTSWYHPAIVNLVTPEYPYELRRAGEVGRVSLGIDVDLQGRIDAIKVLDSDNDALSDAARAAVRHWKFVPVERGSTIVRRHATVTISFELEPSSGIAASIRWSDASS